MTTFTLPAATFVAINKYAASKEATRYYLNGVCIEVRDGKGFMVATDGHKLLCAPFGTQEPDGQYIIPRTLIANLKISRKSEQNVTVGIEGQRVTLTHGDGAFVGQLVDGTFPDWRRAIPSEQNGEFAQFLGAYVKDMDDAAKTAGFGNRAYIGLNGNNPTWVSFTGEEMFGVIMPRLPKDTRSPSRPLWL